MEAYFGVTCSSALCFIMRSACIINIATKTLGVWQKATVLYFWMVKDSVYATKPLMQLSCRHTRKFEVKHISEVDPSPPYPVTKQKRQLNLVTHAPHAHLKY